MVRVRTETIRYSEERATAEKAASYHVKYDKKFHKRISNSSEHALLGKLLERVGELLADGGNGDRTNDTAGLLEVERHLRGARRELSRTRRRLR